MESELKPLTVEEVFDDFKGRRAGIIKALTSDVEEFYQEADPEKENLCLYGLPNKQWEVNLPAEEVPSELPEPTLGINFAREGMEQQEWVSLVAIHSDAWLVSVASFFGSRFGFLKPDRRRLFNMINDLPTVLEVVSGASKKKQKEKSSGLSTKNSNSKPRTLEAQVKFTNPDPKSEEEDSGLDEEEDEDNEEEGQKEDDEQEDTLCGTCGKTYVLGQFWICCDKCENWFHGKCVKITPSKADHIKKYKCPLCSNKRARA